MDTDLLIQLESICRKAGEFQLSHFGKISRSEISDKGLNQLVSFVDIESEKLLVKELEKLYPGCAFITEEGTGIGNEQSDMSWIIDPLDGTTNFIHGVPCYAISIALIREQTIVLGVVYEINLNECFYTWENSAAYMNGKIIHVSTTNKLADALLATGFPYYNYKRMKEYMQLFEYYMQHTRGLRRLGSAATDLAYVACGRFDAFYEYSLQPWDVAAGAFLVQQAGGSVCDFSGSTNFIFGKEIIASNKFCFDEMLTTVKKHFDEQR